MIGHDLLPVGHDSEQAALIYQHETQGADKAITDAIDRHVLGEKTKRGDDWADVSWSSRANGPA